MSDPSPIWIGTSGYVYRHWRQGVFYPRGLPVREELGYYAERFNTVELNNPFYRLPTSEMFDRWRDSTPPNFRFAVKASRYITHIKRLRDVGSELSLFLGRAERLGPKLGPILFQLPPTQQLEPERLKAFLALLSPAHRWVLEFRHPSWHTPAVYRFLAKHAIALCIPVGGRLDPARITTARFTYIRMHRGQEPGGGFTAAELSSWAAQMRGLRRVRKEVYIYFNNDWEGYAVRDATALKELLRPRVDARPSLPPNPAKPPTGPPIG
ncbi:MAG TPA: DUF72 domain-containing protein [Gemmatimonadales bacterium]|nr:DUF72 domain-containing protein [Gemmatimonadales bacterium]